MTQKMTFAACVATEAKMIADIGLPANRIVPIVNTSNMRMTKIVADDANVIITCSGLDQKLVVTRSTPPDLHLIRR